LSTNVATRGVLIRLESSKIVVHRGYAPDPAKGAYDAPSDPLVGWGGAYPSPFLTSLDVFGAWRLDPGPPG